MSKRKSQFGRLLILTICVICAVGVLLVLQTSGAAAGGKSKRQAQQNAFKVYQQKCLGCHDSVADPEKPGRTRDDWHLVVQVMHGYGLDLSTEESGAIIDLLYDLRKGMEREAG
jgi:mono/diheme cytochrome c family protein